MFFFRGDRHDQKQFVDDKRFIIRRERSVPCTHYAGRRETAIFVTPSSHTHTRTHTRTLREVAARVYLAATLLLFESPYINYAGSCQSYDARIFIQMPNRFRRPIFRPIDIRGGFFLLKAFAIIVVDA